MKGLASNVNNALTDYKSTIHIKKRDVLAAARSAVDRASTDDITVDQKITNNKNSQEEADQHNVFRLAAIGVNEGIADGVTNIVGRDIINPILVMTDGSYLKSVDQYHIHQLFTAITEGAERSKSTNIRRQFVNIAGKVFNWRETVVTNIEQMAAMAAKLLGYSVQVHSYLRAVVILSNTEWAAQQTWGAEISVAHRKIVSKYGLNHSHHTESIRDIL